MKHSETEKPQYLYRPVIYFHAANDDEAKTRLHAIKHSIEQGLKDDMTAAPEYTYPDIGHEDGSLSRDRWLTEPGYIVPRNVERQEPMSPAEREAFGA